MPSALAFSLSLFLALALPLAVWAALRRGARPGLALPLVALGIGLVLLALGLWAVTGLREQIVLSQQAQGRVFADTYYVVGPGLYAMDVGLLYLVWSALIALIHRLGRGFVILFLPLVFAAFHLASCILLVAQLAPPIEMPRRYVDYPKAFWLLNQITGVAAFLRLLSLAAVILLFVTAIVQSLVRLAKQPPRT